MLRYARTTQYRPCCVGAASVSGDCAWRLGMMLTLPSHTYSEYNSVVLTCKEFMLRYPQNARFLTEPLLRGARHLRRSVQVSTALRGTCRVRRCGLHTPPHAGRPIAGPRLGSPHRGPASRPL